MGELANLKLVTTKRPSGVPTLLQRRNRLIAKIWEQVQLAKAQQDGKVFSPTVFRTIKNTETGVRSTVESQKRIRPWWWTADNGKICITVKYGAKAIELAKGKSAIEVGSLEELVPTLETLKAVVSAGELDAQLELVSKSLSAGFKQVS
ncbi:DUF6641 family protein [Herbaspirillum sp.]|jgi:hypothetical protein|uniref:DUF6641 family protein n=1 Tax=Herbaspirillum TaxID=963 RepID=UPI002583F06A|nr:DUF6641 family protein [Herbaspirillum sp.]MCP3654580.1 hypothetical protein [Herbaspirillum sp.]MCP3948664.1 hypothetical protein [Herbaspirillum sp.]MCP4033243.1 hypothetical protein [Herbaspirillum sp.]MCP4556194.1 hypothetical protein [Herbaspirillum sp.]